MFDKKVSSDYNILLSLRFILLNILSLSFTIPLSEKRLRSPSPPETPPSVFQCNARSTLALYSLSRRTISGVTGLFFSFMDNILAVLISVDSNFFIFLLSFSNIGIGGSLSFDYKPALSMQKASIHRKLISSEDHCWRKSQRKIRLDPQ